MYPQKMPPKADSNRNIRALAKLAFVITFLAGAFLLTRAYFLQQTNPNFISGNTITSTTTSAPLNQPIVISGVTIPKGSGTTSVWGDKITNVKGLPATTGSWLKVSANTGDYIGEMVGLEFRQLFQSTLPMRDMRLFADKSTLYVTKPVAGTGQQLAGFQSPQLSKLYEFEITQIVQSIYFEPTRREYYYAWGKSANEINTVTILRPSGGTLQVLQTNYYLIDKILDVNVASNSVLFRGKIAGSNTVGCFIIDTVSKEVDDYECEYINTTGTQAYYRLAEPTANGAVDVQLVDRVQLRKTDVADAEDHQFRQFLAQNVGLLAWHEVNPDGQSVVVFNTTSKSNLKEIKTLPDGEVMDVTVDAAGVASIVVVNGGVQQVYRETTLDGLTQWQALTFTQCSQGCSFEFIKI